MRLQRSLAGTWRFQLDPAGSLRVDSLQPDRSIAVPLPWQAAFPELREYSGYAWYQQHFTLDEPWLAGELLLEFGAVDYWCEVYLNGACVGEHEGGFTPFRLPIGAQARLGENTLAVRVYDTTQRAVVFPRWATDSRDRGGPPFDALSIPQGKQGWYVDWSGIWQDVTLTAVPARYVDRAHVTPDIRTGQVEVSVRLAGAAEPGRVTVALEGQPAEVDAPPGMDEVHLTLRVPDPALWTPDSPTLYEATVRLETAGGADEISVRFGFRELTTREGYLLLNGEPIYLLAALDQDLYPGTIATVPSEDFLRDQFAKAKHLGLNALRCHIKPPDPRYLDLADEMGLLVWAEIPSWRMFYPKTTVQPDALHLDDAIKVRVEDMLAAMVARDYNHPSLVIWTLVNEDWGTALFLSQSDRDWVAALYARCKRLDPTRLVVDNSPCPAPWGLSVHVRSDLDDFHVYHNIPDAAEAFDQFADHFGTRPMWTFSNFGDAQRTGHEPLILSEFGNWGMPALGGMGEREPNWFDLGGWWSAWDGEPGYAAGVRQRFDRLGLRAIWADYAAFAEATQRHEYRALKFQIEALRRQPAVQGYVITELSDIYWEANGLLDFDRAPKVFHNQFARLNAPDLIIPHLRRFVYWDDELVQVELAASHYSAADWSDARVEAYAGEHRVVQAEVQGMVRGEVRTLPPAQWALPRVERATEAALDLRAEFAGGRAENDVSVLVLPAAFRRATWGGGLTALMQPRPWRDTNDAAYRALAPLGYQIQRTLGPETDLLLTDSPTPDMLAWVREGGRMLFLGASSSGSPFFWQHGRGGPYGGHWITSWGWLRPGIFRRVDVESPLGLPFKDIMPPKVIVGVPLDDPALQQDFLAGQIAGWVQHPALYALQLRYGKGRVVMCTFNLVDTLWWHPLAVTMFHDLVDYVTSDECQPVLRANY